MKKIVKVRLFNGAKSSGNLEETEILAESVRLKGNGVKLFVPEDMIELAWDENGFVEHEGVFYGDIEISG